MTNTIDQKNEKREATLVRQAQEGSKEAFCELYGLYKDRLYRYALYRLGDPDQAEDAVSDCVLAAWRDLGRLRTPSAFGGWIFRILHNICAGMIRKEIAGRENLSRYYEQNQQQESSGPLFSIELAEALAQLSDDERSVVLLSVVSGMTSKEISDITGLTPGAARSKLSRSLSKMRSFLS